MCERTMQTSVSLHTWPGERWPTYPTRPREASRAKPPAHGSCVSAALRPSSHWALPRTRDTTQGRPERWVDRKQAGGVVVILTDPEDRCCYGFAGFCARCCRAILTAAKGRYFST